MRKVLQIAVGGVASGIVSTFTGLALRASGVLDPYAETVGAWIGVQMLTVWYSAIALFGLALWLTVMWFTLKNSPQKLIVKSDQSDNWINREDTAQLVYDTLTSGRFPTEEMALGIIQKMKNPPETPWEFVRLRILKGIQSGTICARGFRNHRSELENVPASIDEDPWDQSREFEVQDSDGNGWTLVEFERSSVLKHIESLT